MGAEADWPIPIGSDYVPTPRRPPTPEREPTPAVLEPFAEDERQPAALKSWTKRAHALGLARALGEVSAGTIQDALEVGRAAAHQILSRLERAGHLRRLAHGRYVPATKCE